MRLAATALAASLLALPAPAGAQAEGEAPPETVFVERIDVEIVNLDVVVTDRKGDPIAGLGREDFVLRVDGEPTSIDNFYAVGLEVRQVAAPEEEEREAGPAATGEGSAPPQQAALALAAAPPEQELRLLVLFDNRHATPGERKRVAEDLAGAFEGGLDGAGRAAVASYDGGVEVRQPFTADGAALPAAIRELGVSGFTGYGEAFDRRNLLREIDQVDLGGGSPQMEAEQMLNSIEVYGEQKAADVRMTLAALASQVESLSGLPGRKVLLYVTSGLELEPTEVLFAAWYNKFGQFTELARRASSELRNQHTDLRDRLREVTRAANAGRVALYAVGTSGAGPSQAVSADQGGFDFGGMSSPGGGRSYDTTVDTVFRTTLGAGLELMAEVTGGEALTGSGNYDLIARRVQQDAGYRYSLGFRPPTGSERGTDHRIEVEVPGHQEAHLRYRREIVLSTPAERAAEETLAALLWDHADNDLGVAAQVGSPQPSEQDPDRFMLPVLVKVPFANLVLLPERRVHRGRITLFVVAEDERGRLSPVQTVEAPIEIPANRLDEALAGVAGYRVGLLVRPGPHRLAIGVRDEIGDTVSSLAFAHDVVAP